MIASVGRLKQCGNKGWLQGSRPRNEVVMGQCTELLSLASPERLRHRRCRGFQKGNGI
ncbi:hypothetical protein [uncultured Megasphaera sp.]|uniref:hypothetical protein n=1 Tax=uncultured Megasphaera sp. TaxID=165188 RepID=UPI00288C564E|nr:hypothetical protein [uncultured Megasphaera sp.]